MKEGLQPEQRDMNLDKDNKRSKLKKRLKQALAAAVIVGGSAVIVERGINMAGEAEKNADLDKNNTEQAAIIPGDTEQGSDSVQFEVPENPEIQTVDINGAQEFRKMQKERPIQEFSNNTQEERLALMDEIIEETCDWVSERYSSEEADGLREVAKEVYTGLIYIDSGPIRLEAMLATMVDQLESDRSQTL